jgi:hypothetical protein
MRWLLGGWLMLVGASGAVHTMTLNEASGVAPTGAAAARAFPAKAQSKAAVGTPVSDLCAPCSLGDQCDSGTCLVDNATGDGVCTQTNCAPTGTTPCPSGFTCQKSQNTGKSYCNPNDETVCPAVYQGVELNDISVLPQSAALNPNGAFSRPCRKGLVSFPFPTGIAACLNTCSSIDPNLTCEPNQRCCFGPGLDANGYCRNSTSPSMVGGCIAIQNVGSNCAEPDRSVCTMGAVCFSTGVAADAKCYVSCAAGDCSADGRCATIDNIPVCCDLAQYSVNDAATCVPVGSTCSLGVGVACTLNADCESQYCLKKGSQSACSVPCTSDANCPAASDDVNGDGIADGGGTCLTLGTGKYCWPRTTPAAQPNCFLAAVAASAAPADNSDGCTCRNANDAPLWALALWGLVLARRRRRLRRAC